MTRRFRQHLPKPAREKQYPAGTLGSVPPRSFLWEDVLPDKRGRLPVPDSGTTTIKARVYDTHEWDLVRVWVPGWLWHLFLTVVDGPSNAAKLWSMMAECGHLVDSRGLTLREWLVARELGLPLPAAPPPAPDPYRPSEPSVSTPHDPPPPAAPDPCGPLGLDLAALRSRVLALAATVPGTPPIPPPPPPRKRGPKPKPR